MLDKQENESNGIESVKIPVVVCALIDRNADIKSLVDFMCSIQTLKYHIDTDIIELRSKFNNDDEAVLFFLEEIEKATSNNKNLNTLFFYSDYNTKIYELLKDQLDDVFTFDLVQVGASQSL